MYSLKQSIQDPEKFVIDLTFNEPVPIVTDENGVDTPNIKQAEEELLLLGWDADGAKEMAHAFDTSCIQISADGQRISPLTDEDLMKYQERALHMVDNMNRIELADGVNMNGLAKVQEMFADLVGLRVTLDVIKKTEGFDYDRFFQALTKKFFPELSEQG